MNCQYCNNTLRQGAKFCNSCGKKIIYPDTMSVEIMDSDIAKEKFKDALVEPFILSDDIIKIQFMNWIVSLDDAPIDAVLSTIVSVERLYLPIMSFKFLYTAKYQALCIWEHEETYEEQTFETVYVDDSGQEHRVKSVGYEAVVKPKTVTKQRTVQDHSEFVEREISGVDTEVVSFHNQLKKWIEYRVYTNNESTVFSQSNVQTVPIMEIKEYQEERYMDEAKDRLSEIILEKCHSDCSLIGKKRNGLTVKEKNYKVDSKWILYALYKITYMYNNQEYTVFLKKDWEYLFFSGLSENEINSEQLSQFVDRFNIKKRLNNLRNPTNAMAEYEEKTRNKYNMKFCKVNRPVDNAITAKQRQNRSIMTETNIETANKGCLLALAIPLTVILVKIIVSLGIGMRSIPVVLLGIVVGYLGYRYSNKLIERLNSTQANRKNAVQSFNEFNTQLGDTRNRIKEVLKSDSLNYEEKKEQINQIIGYKP